ncbi:SsgA family sporulation/cell division regulator [Streptomyces sp. NPDC047315]|uniref:SsgA family sporulation/cell division regulator n=1 Tax=Streptomyces sp. NPDC047315 TaxID=3155142 RepID=UPI0033F2DD18
MSTSTVVIEEAVQARIVASAPRAEPLSVTLRYETDDPFAVRMAFPPNATLEGTEVSWAFARSLLSAGLVEPVGVGDVRVRPYGYDRTVVEFHAPEGVAVVHVHSGDVRRFLKRVEDVAPEGHEHRFLDLDHDLSQLLGDVH